MGRHGGGISGEAKGLSTRLIAKPDGFAYNRVNPNGEPTMKVTNITIHTSATPQGADIGVKEIRAAHKRRGWTDVGYHFVIRVDGTTEKGRSTLVQGAHVGGHNTGNIGICLIGGLDHDGNSAFTYSNSQMLALEKLVGGLLTYYGLDKTAVLGHRDWYGDTNHDGAVDSKDWLKECPCFDAREWARSQF